MVVLALDIGETRIGIAASDRSGRVAMPVKVMNADEVINLARPFRMLLEDASPSFLMRLPKPWRESEALGCERIKGCCSKALPMPLDCPVAFADERLSSREAKRILRERVSASGMRGKVDMIAASLFLQVWLDGHDRPERPTRHPRR